MLLQLSVQNFILIDTLSIEFESGLSVFTGETGAGKSLMVDALTLLSGGRASSSFIGNNHDKASVEGVFLLKENSLAYRLAKEYGYDVDDVLVFTREISKDNKNTCKINHKIVPLSTFKEILDSEIDIHSQHDTQYLLHDKNHLVLLDNYTQNNTLKDEVKDAYKHLLEARKAKEEVTAMILDESDRDFLLFQLQELEDFQPSQEDYDQLITKQKQMLSFEKLSTHTNQALSTLNDDGGVLEQVYETFKQLDSLKEDESLASIASMVLDGYSILEQAKQELSDYVYNLSFDQDTFDEILERLATYDRLKRKHGGSITSLLDKMESISNTLYNIDHHQQILSEAQQKEEVAFAHFNKLAKELSELRKQSALKLSNDIAKHLKDLQLPHAHFDVRFDDNAPSKHGIDKITFYLKTNPGSQFAPLSKIASGGELSRLMLGLKAIFTPLQGCGTIIFDEIDVGVSGAVAAKVGAKMDELSTHVQTFTITHLPVVASYGDQHFNVLKKVDKNKTMVTIEKLDYQNIIKQLALMSSGTTTSESLAAAKVLYDDIQKKRYHG